MQNTTIENVYRQNLKEKILQVATVLFYRHGIRQVRMDDISNNLRISKRTLYEIYDNKEVLLLGVLQHNSEKEHQSMQNFDKSGANVISIILEFYRLRMKELSRMSPLFFEDIRKYPRLLSYIDKQHRQHDIDAKAFMRRGVEEGYFLPNINYDIIRELSSAAGREVMKGCLYKTYDIKELFKTSIILFVRGICTPKGLRMLDEAINIL
ncbi:MAG: TetR/AcrR family transcriptional regulator [Prevotella histicola]|uniref:TetR/AcrR family transcriptional regulator n=1 Tax=Prevotella histicola TaxID=470565 RepID=UPI00361FC966